MIRNGVRVQYKVLSVLMALSAGSVCVELPIISIVLLLTGTNFAHEAKDGLVKKRMFRTRRVQGMHIESTWIDQ